MFNVMGINPWLSMWGHPRNTIQALISTKPSVGVFRLSYIFVLQSIFFYANWWSLGLNTSYKMILFFGAVLAIPLSFVWIYLMGWIFYLTGRLCKGMAPSQYLRTVIAWSKVPVSISLTMWLILIAANPEQAFIQTGEGPSSLFVSLIALILGIWSFVLLVQGIRQVQQFSIRRSIFNILLAWMIWFIFLVLMFSLFRFLWN